MAKKIMIIDGGPRKNFNTASMLQKFAEGAMSVSSDVEVKVVRLYGIDYKGCMSCMARRISGINIWGKSLARFLTELTCKLRCSL